MRPDWFAKGDRPVQLPFTKIDGATGRPPLSS